MKNAVEHLARADAVEASQVGSFLTALKLSGKEHSADTLTAAADVMRSHAFKATIAEREDFVVDIVGTGGDGHNTFNVSTTSAMVAAGAGARVCKHGNQASTSSSGSADVLVALGCSLPPPSFEPLPRMPFFFLLASHYHPGVVNLAAIRKSLPFRSLFNILGPLMNPARPRGMVMGVYDPELGPVFAEALRGIGVERALVVCGMENLDEISIAGGTRVWHLEDGKITYKELHPDLFGLPTHPLSDVVGSTPAVNAAIVTAMLQSQPPPPGISAQSYQAMQDFVLLNTSALLVVSGLAQSYKHGVELARKSIQSGEAYKALEAFRNYGNSEQLKN
jgi:anthranilate phosphoribosyltransferase